MTADAQHKFAEGLGLVEEALPQLLKDGKLQGDNFAALEQLVYAAGYFIDTEDDAPSIQKRVQEASERYHAEAQRRSRLTPEERAEEDKIAQQKHNTLNEQFNSLAKGLSKTFDDPVEET